MNASDSGAGGCYRCGRPHPTAAVGPIPLCASCFEWVERLREKVRVRA